MKVTIPALAAVISLAVFACSESPSSPSTDSSSSEVSSSSLGEASNGSSSSSDNSSGEVLSSSSSITSSSSSRASSSSVLGITGRACNYPSEDLGLSGLSVCGDAPSDMLDLQKYKTECEDDGGTWINACPDGEKTTCIYEEDEYDKNVLYKIYLDDFTCGDFFMKNADGSDDIVPKGGACGPFAPYENVPLSMCLEALDQPTNLVKLSCAMLEAPFASECPSNADLVCYDPEEEANYHLYGEATSSLTCEMLGMEEL